MVDADHRIFLVAGAALFALGFHGLLAQAHLLRRVIALNVMGTGVFVIFIALAAQIEGPVPDPIPHSMVLTGIVVSVCATAVALALADQVQILNGRAELDDSEGDDGKPDQGQNASNPQ